MNWIIASVLMFFSSIIFYLTVKKLQIIGIEKRTISLVNNLFSAGMFGIIAYTSSVSLIVSLWYLFLIIVLRVVFNYVGGIAGYKSMEIAPNAGYSLVIQKSYAIYTLFAAVILFGSEVSVRKFVIAVFVLFCAGYIAYSKGKDTDTHNSNTRWAMYALISMFSYGTLALSSKYLFSLGITPTTILFWSGLFTASFAWGDSRRLKLKIGNMSYITIFYLILLGVSVTAFSYFKLLAELSAPNLGYVGAINSASNAAYTLLVALIFKDSISKEKFIAILAMTTGLIMLLFS